MYTIAHNSLGRWTASTEFVHMFYQKTVTKKEFVPLDIKRLYYENKDTKTSEPRSDCATKA